MVTLGAIIILFIPRAVMANSAAVMNTLRIIGGAIGPGHMLRKWRRLGGKAAIFWGAPDLSPVLRLDAGADVGRSAGRAGTDIKIGAQGPERCSSDNGERHADAYQATA